MVKDGKMKQKKPKGIDRIVGFGAVEKLGYKLSNYEIELIADYATQNEEEKAYIKEVLRTRGRPYSLYKSGFKSKCKICGALRNYCCC